jgi:hypothetical protein
MIMPCIKSMSAAEGMVRWAEVSGGRFLLGWPGAPGWTIGAVGGVGAACWHGAAAAKMGRTRSKRRLEVIGRWLGEI